jgi:hypothetical protein
MPYTMFINSDFSFSSDAFQYILTLSSGSPSLIANSSQHIKWLGVPTSRLLKDRY